MGNLVFPTLPGLMFGRSKRPEWNTKIQKAVSGKEFRSAWMSAPLYTFSLPYEFLRENASYAELQQLVALFNNVQGSFDSFLYSDPSDNSVTGQQFGTGNGVQTQFQLVRSYGGNLEAVGNLNGAPSIYINGALKNPSGAPELFPNGGFNNDIMGWVPIAGTTLTWSAGVLDALSTSASNELGGFSVTCEIGKTYQISYVRGLQAGVVYTYPLSPEFNMGAGRADILGANIFTFVATATTMNFYFRGGAAYSHSTFDNVSVKLTNDYTISATGVVTFAAAPANTAVLTWTGSYYYRCRFLQDSLDFSEFMSGLWEAKKVEFIGSLSPNRI